MGYEDILSVLETYGIVRIDMRSVEANIKARRAGTEPRPVIARLYNDYGLSVNTTLGSSRSNATSKLYKALKVQIKYNVGLIEQGD